MIGSPKFKYGDEVSFVFDNQTKIGSIAIVDAYGTWENPDEVSYGILVTNEQCIYKHITESLVKPLK